MTSLKTPTDNGRRCSIQLDRGARLLQEKWVLFIVHRLLDGPLGFNELVRQAEGINTATLSQRLSLLEQTGLVAKTVHSYMPPRTSYELTEAGKALRPVIDSIEAWSARHLSDLPPSAPSPIDTITGIE
jgi:DNA-binding HxlR family transcriptional regulator